MDLPETKVEWGHWLALDNGLVDPFQKIVYPSVGWLVRWFYGVSTLFGSFNAELNFTQFSLTEVHSLNVKTVRFQLIQFSIYTHS